MSLDVQLSEVKLTSVFDSNVTHNLVAMAKEAGIYQVLWRPEELEITTARDLITPLEIGLNLLLSDRKRFEQFNPSNGWGSYNSLVSFVENYLAACKQNPNSTVSVSR